MIGVACAAFYFLLIYGWLRHTDQQMSIAACDLYY
jgi:hypothetical protein